MLKSICNWFSQIFPQEPFKDLQIRPHNFAYFFDDSWCEVPYILVAYILYARYKSVVNFQDIQSKMNVFSIAYMIAIKMMHDEEDVTNVDFIREFQLSFRLISKFSDYEYEFCDTIKWELFVDLPTYENAHKLAKNGLEVKQLVLNS